MAIYWVFVNVSKVIQPWATKKICDGAMGNPNGTVNVGGHCDKYILYAKNAPPTIASIKVMPIRIIFHFI
jgi:hypothetical protein